MPIYPGGSLNTSALNAPDLYVQVVPPRTRFINGVATDGLGLVGVASWGPVNSPFRISSDTDLAFLLGQPLSRPHDLATAVSISLQMGATSINCVRVTNDTDTRACATLSKFIISGQQATLQARYTGSRGNLLRAVISKGTAVNSWKIIISLPGVSAEVFDNLKGEDLALWNALSDAINFGQHAIRGPSQLVTALLIPQPNKDPKVADTNPSPQSDKDAQDNDNTSKTFSDAVRFSGGTDGSTRSDQGAEPAKSGNTFNDHSLLGKDSISSSRTGMYALRGTGSQVINLVDVTDSSCWPEMAAFGESEGSYVISQGAASTDCIAMSKSLNASGVDDWHLKLMVGDWPYWKDTANGVNRMVAPATVEAANIAARSPHISTLNKRIPVIIATERQLVGRPYSVPEIGAINAARLDVITNPCPGGYYYGVRSGRNTSSNPTQNDDTYTRMTNFLSLTIAASFGGVVGDNQTVDLRRETKSTLESFLSNLETLKMIGDPNGGPAFAVRLDETNNPDSRVALGYMTADVQVKYLNVVRYFLVNLEGGGSVSISVSNDASR